MRGRLLSPSAAALLSRTPDHLHQVHGMVCVIDNGSATATSDRDGEVLKELRRPHGQNHTGHVSEDMHIHHQPHARLGEGDPDNHRKGRLRKLAHVGLEHALVIIDQAHTGQGYPYPQNQGLQPLHKELEVGDEVYDNEHQSKSSSHKVEYGDVRHSAHPIVGGGKTDGLQYPVAHFLHNPRKPTVHGGKTNRHSHHLKRVGQ